MSPFVWFIWHHSIILCSLPQLLTVSCFFFLQRGKALCKALNWSVSCCLFDSSEDECWGKLTSSASSSVDMDLIWAWGFEEPGLIHLPSCAIIPNNHINTGFKGSGQVLITYTGPRFACICFKVGGRPSFFPCQNIHSTGICALYFNHVLWSDMFRSLHRSNMSSIVHDVFIPLNRRWATTAIEGQCNPPISQSPISQ